MNDSGQGNQPPRSFEHGGTFTARDDPSSPLPPVPSSLYRYEMTQPTRTTCLRRHLQPAPRGDTQKEQHADRFADRKFGPCLAVCTPEPPDLRTPLSRHRLADRKFGPCLALCTPEPPDLRTLLSRIEIDPSLITFFLIHGLCTIDTFHAFLVHDPLEWIAWLFQWLTPEDIPPAAPHAHLLAIYKILLGLEQVLALRCEHGFGCVLPSPPSSITTPLAQFFRQRTRPETIPLRRVPPFPAQRGDQNMDEPFGIAPKLETLLLALLLRCNGVEVSPELQLQTLLLTLLISAV
jgi:hypothetical protein